MPAGQGFWHPDPVIPRYLLPRPGPDQKIVNFMDPNPGSTRLHLPRTGPDRNNLASTRN